MGGWGRGGEGEAEDKVGLEEGDAVVVDGRVDDILADPRVGRKGSNRGEKDAVHKVPGKDKIMLGSSLLQAEEMGEVCDGGEEGRVAGKDVSDTREAPDVDKGRQIACVGNQIGSGKESDERSLARSLCQRRERGRGGGGGGGRGGGGGGGGGGESPKDHGPEEEGKVAWSQNNTLWRGEGEEDGHAADVSPRHENPQRLERHQRRRWFGRGGGWVDRMGG